MQQNDYILDRNIRIKKIQITPQTNIKPDHTFHTPTQTFKYIRQIYTQVQENMGMGSSGNFYNRLKIYYLGL